MASTLVHVCGKQKRVCVCVCVQGGEPSLMPPGHRLLLADQLSRERAAIPLHALGWEGNRDQCLVRQLRSKSSCSHRDVGFLAVFSCCSLGGELCSFLGGSGFSGIAWCVCLWWGIFMTQEVPPSPAIPTALLQC